MTRHQAVTLCAMLVAAIASASVRAAACDTENELGSRDGNFRRYHSSACMPQLEGVGLGSLDGSDLSYGPTLRNAHPTAERVVFCPMINDDQHEHASWNEVVVAGYDASATERVWATQCTSTIDGSLFYCDSAIFSCGEPGSFYDDETYVGPFQMTLHSTIGLPAMLDQAWLVVALPADEAGELSGYESSEGT